MNFLLQLTIELFLLVVLENRIYLIQNGASDPFYWAPFVVLD